MALTKRELRDIHSILCRIYLGQLARPFLEHERFRANDLAERVHLALETMKPELEKGEKVLEWRVPREQAPSLNQYAYMKPWMKKQVARALDDMLITAKTLYRRADLNMAKRKRWVRATRFSTKEIDDSSIDVIGGKMPMDALVRAGMLVDDNPEWCIREARAEKTKPGNAHLFIEVFEVTTEGEEAPLPEDAEVPQAQREPGFFTKHLKGE